MDQYIDAPLIFGFIFSSAFLFYFLQAPHISSSFPPDYPTKYICDVFQWRTAPEERI